MLYYNVREWVRVRQMKQKVCAYRVIFSAVCTRTCASGRACVSIEGCACMCVCFSKTLLACESAFCVQVEKCGYGACVRAFWSVSACICAYTICTYRNKPITHRCLQWKHWPGPPELSPVRYAAAGRQGREAGSEDTKNIQWQHEAQQTNHALSVSTAQIMIGQCCSNKTQVAGVGDMKVLTLPRSIRVQKLQIKMKLHEPERCKRNGSCWKMHVLKVKGLCLSGAILYAHPPLLQLRLSHEVK